MQASGVFICLLAEGPRFARGKKYLKKNIYKYFSTHECPQKKISPIGPAEYMQHIDKCLVYYIDFCFKSLGNILPLNKFFFN